MNTRLDDLFEKYDENPLDANIIFSIVKEYLKKLIWMTMLKII